MKEKDLETIKILQLLLTKQMSQIQAAKQLDISERQVRNKLQRYKEFGDKGVISKKLGRASNNQLSEDLKSKALQFLKTIYYDFGPKLAKEKLEEDHGIVISIESVRQMMIINKLWTPKRGADPVIHKLRPRRDFEGELFQADGSKHYWFENRGPQCCLLVLIDDATSSTVRLLFVPTENLEGYFELVKAFFIERGLPLELYTDRFSVFEVMKKNPLLEEGALTQFERALRELGVKLIKAKTPQAKGRVERVNRTFQDRLVKELRLRGISDIASANAFLTDGIYLKKHNAQFAVPAPKKGNVFRALKESQLKALDRILSRNYTRVVQKDLSFQFEKDIYQICMEKEDKTDLRGQRIIVWKDSTNRVKAEFKGNNLAIYSMREKEWFSRKPTQEELLFSWGTRKRYIPRADHPYKRSYKNKLTNN